MAWRGYGPFTPGFRVVPFGDIDAVAAAVDDTTVAVMLEPVQGEAGVVIPPDGFLRQVRELCDARGVLMVADEVQSGLGRSGRTFACDHEDVVPDVYVLGKALGGGIVPVSAVVADQEVLGVFEPGSHGSTFGGNPLGAAIGREVVAMLSTGELQANAARLGTVLERGLGELVSHGVLAVRCRGLWAGVDVDPGLMTGRQLCEAHARHRACWPRTPTDPRSGWRRRSSQPRTTSRSSSRRSTRCCPTHRPDAWAAWHPRWGPFVARMVPSRASRPEPTSREKPCQDSPQSFSG